MHNPKKHLGQNFLTDELIIERIIKVLNVQSSDHTIEIGPGQGALTHHLACEAGSLDLIEFDTDLIKPLEETFDQPNVSIHHQDILKTDITLLSNDEFSIRIVGNIPYNISSPIIFHIIEHRSCIEDVHLMLQYEVAKRLAASPGSKTFGRLSVMTQYFFDIFYLFDVDAQCFNPPPKIQSAFIRMTPRKRPENEQVNKEIFSSVVKNAFSQRRKTIRNSLKSHLNLNDFNSLNINPQLRAEALELSSFIKISKYLENKDA